MTELEALKIVWHGFAHLDVAADYKVATKEKAAIDLVEELIARLEKVSAGITEMDELTALKHAQGLVGDYEMMITNGPYHGKGIVKTCATVRGALAGMIDQPLKFALKTLDAAGIELVPKTLLQETITATLQAANGDVKYPVRKFLDVSTSHLSEETASGMNAWGAETGSGWWVWVPEDEQHVEATSAPDDLKSVMYRACVQGCAYVLFDADGGVLEGLPTYEW